jgi:hypothetical protein
MNKKNRQKKLKEYLRQNLGKTFPGIEAISKVETSKELKRLLVTYNVVKNTRRGIFAFFNKTQKCK